MSSREQSKAQAKQAAPRPKGEMRKQQDAGGRKLQADFLLNFQRPSSYQRPQNSNYAQPLPQRRSQASGRSRATAASFGKGRFVQSNFRILVDELTPDVVEATVDPDALIDWGSVRRVDLQQEVRLKCPICLEEDMVVPKITRCGHVFCASCVMRYFLSLQEYNGKFWQKCPVCNTQQIAPEELISVRLETARQPKEGDRVRFVLARRGASATVVRPPPTACPPCSSSSSAAPRPRGRNEGPFDLPVEGEQGWQFSRLVRMPRGRWMRMLSEEIETLTAYRTSCRSSGDTELFPSIDAAIKLLQQLQEKIRKERGDEVEEEVFEELQLPSLAESPQPQDGDEEDWERQDAGEEEEDWIKGDDELEAENAGNRPHGASDASGATPGDVTPAGSPKRGPASTPGAGTPAGTPLVGPAPSPDEGRRGGSSTSGAVAARSGGGGGNGGGSRGARIRFYQAEDGRPVFLQPLFTRMLVHEHGGTWESLPDELPVVKVEKVHSQTLCEETRRRHRFLSHLPLGSHVCFAEVDLRSVLSRETKEHFAEDFERLRQQRKKDIQKSRREDRVSKERALKEEEQYYHGLNRLHPSEITFQAVPTKEDFVPLPGREAAEDDALAGDGAEIDEPTGPTLAMKLKQRMAAKAKPKAGRGRGRGSAAPPPPPADDASWGPALGSSVPSSRGRGRGAAAASSGPSAAGSSAAAAGASSGASGGGSAWGRGLGSDRAEKGRGAAYPAESAAPAAAPESPAPARKPWGPPPRNEHVPDNWEDEEDDKPNFGAALDAALKSATASSSAAASASPPANEAEAQNADGEQPEPAEPAEQAEADTNAAAGGKKKKGRAAKATTIRLFG